MDNLTHEFIAGDSATLLRALPIDPGRVRSRRLFKGAGVTVVGIAIDAGAVMKEHRAAVPILLQVLEGRVAVDLPSGPVELQKGAMIHVEAEVVHGVEGLTAARLLLFLLDCRIDAVTPGAPVRPIAAKSRPIVRVPGASDQGAARMVLATSGADAAAVDAIAGAHSELSGALAYATNRAFDVTTTGPTSTPSSLSQLLDWCNGPLATHLAAERAAFGPILAQIDPTLAERVRIELAEIDDAILGLTRATTPSVRAVAIVRVRTLVGRHLRTMDEVVLPVIAGTSTLSLADTWKHLQRAQLTAV